jgi:hypothetical protein
MVAHTGHHFLSLAMPRPSWQKIAWLQNLCIHQPEFTLDLPPQAHDTVPAVTTQFSGLDDLKEGKNTELVPALEDIEGLPLTEEDLEEDERAGNVDNVL